ncbi:reverse transcriptase domain-containing protein [Tanacetum coccineum]
MYPFTTLFKVVLIYILISGRHVNWKIDGLPMMPKDPYAYVEATMQEPPPPDFVLKPVYPEFMPLEDDVLPAEEQPLPAIVSPIADSPGYIIESDLEEDPEEEGAEDHEEDLADYPTDKDDDEEEESSGDDVNDEEEDEGEDEKEEDHLDPADSVLPLAHRTTGRMSIRAQTPIPFLSEAEIPSPPLLVSSPLPIPPSPLPASPTHSLGYRAAMIQLRAELLSTSHLLPQPPPIILPRTKAFMVMMRVVAPSTYILAPRSETPPSGTPPLLPIPLPTSSPPLLLPSTDCRADVIEVTLPPQKRLCIAPGPRYEVGECSYAPTARPTRGFRADYGFVGTLDAKIRRDLDKEIGYGFTDVREDPNDIAEEILVTDVAELGQRMTDFASHARTLDLWRGRQSSREAWVQSMDASDTTCSKTQMVELQSQQRPAREFQHILIVTKEPVVSLIWLRTYLFCKLLQNDTNERTTRASPATITTTTPVTNAQLKALINQGVADALVAHDVDRSWNDNDSHNSGTGSRRKEHTARECTYTNFLKCQPMNFKGTEGVVGLTQWFERMETLFNISNCVVENQVKFATCNLHGVALTWWKSHVKTVGQDAAHIMPWNTLMKMITAKYCPRDKIKKLEMEIRELKVKGTDLASYTQRFQELALMCRRIISINRKFDDTSRNNQNQQQQNKKQNTGRAYTAGSGEKKPYGGSKPLCSKCNYHHDGQCAPKCHKYNRVGHLARDCRSTANANTANNQRGTGAGQKATCFECGAQGYFKRECPKLKNNNRGNPVGSGNAPAKVYAVGHAGTNPDSNIVTGTFLLNNRYASILFDTGADRSFVSTAFSS